MKRLFYPILVLAGLLMGFAGEAHAVKIKNREIGWWTSTATTVNPVNTPRKGFGTGYADTTFLFSLADVSCPTAALQGAANTDSVTIGWVRFFTDTTVAVTNTLSTVSYVIEASGDGNTWAAVVNNASNAIVASGDQHFAIPLWFNSGEGNSATGVKTSPLLTAPYLRVRFTAGTGNFFAARAQLLYWSD